MDRIEENISQDERRVADLIGTLRHVDAPGDFETRVRARIASGRPVGRRAYWLPVLTTVTAVVMIGVVGYLALRSPKTETSIPIAQAPAVTDPVPTLNAQQPSTTSNTRPVVAPSISPAAETAATNKQGRPKKVAAAHDSQGGSFDEASRDSQHLPRRNAADHGFGRTDIPLSSVLRDLGVEAAWNGSGWRVNWVDANNAAGHTGIRAGDVIEAVNGQPVAESTSFKGSFNGKSLRVRRGDSVVELPFKP